MLNNPANISLPTDIYLLHLKDPTLYPSKAIIRNEEQWKVEACGHNTVGFFIWINGLGRHPNVIYSAIFPNIEATSLAITSKEYKKLQAIETNYWATFQIESENLVFHVKK